ncbi:VOC family protein [Chondromyces crocatus]|uniref:Glyoxalase/bleomycin resistance protein/dioxygenase n=1 Tax=Chondromyces crocatus TaxID=52 RepID=A0A0K1ELG3_CHOCO|nr:VOC family protein [Chondromyces crocatus]AKT41453.1 glyoxalase/bleomycin resistance protein/dioxygenase [Chondromyces crocatus]
MPVSVTNHLNFRGNARAALEFYQSVFGGDVTILTYEDARNVQVPAEAEQVMWGQVAAKNGFRVMAYDVPAAMPWDEGKNAFFVSVRGDSAAEITALWEKLSAGATIAQPLSPSGWSPLYGMLKDRFGITWVIDVATEYKAS